jgi:tryptophanyl-tRNA synthetase
VVNNSLQIRYGDLKEQLAEDMIFFTIPFRERIKAPLSDEEYVSGVARTGREKAQEVPQKPFVKCGRLPDLRDSD